MNSLADKGRRKIFIGVATIVVILLITIGYCIAYLNDYYPADKKAIDAFVPVNSVSKEELEDNTIVYIPENPQAGFIFYPGGKVEYTAYEPLMEACASEGILCVLIEMPFNLAVLDVDAAKGIQEQYPQIKKWYIGGHSLGGSMAASYLSEHTEDFEGLILLGSYSTENLSDTSLNILSIYGSEDKVLNHEKYQSNKSNLPNEFTEVVIEGGSHAYFGMYGLQEGDGTPRISNKEQINQTVDQIAEFIETQNITQ